MRNITESIYASMNESEKLKSGITDQDIEDFIENTSAAEWKKEESYNTGKVWYKSVSAKKSLDKLELNYTAHAKDTRAAHSISPGSEADHYDCYLAILSWEKETPGGYTIPGSVSDRCKGNKKIFDMFDKAGLKEVNGKRNPQWGTWKFAIRNADELKIAEDVINKFFGKSK